MSQPAIPPSTTSQSAVSTQATGHQLLLLGLSAAVFFVNLGAARLWDIDEAIFSQAAAEMNERGDYVVPYFNHQLFPDKPALMYWGMISAYKVFGVNEFAARFWSAVFGLGAVLLTYQLGRRLFSPRVGFWAGLILATNLNFGIIARAATPDAMLTFFSTLALLIFVVGALRRTAGTRAEGCRAADASGVAELREPGWGTYALAYAAMGAAVLVKGPIGVVLPTAVIGLFLLCTRGPNSLARLPAELPGHSRFAWLRRLLDASVRTLSPVHFVRTIYGMRPITALLAVLLVAGPWYVWVGLRTDWRWPALFFGEQNVGRFVNAMDNHRGPIVYYLGAILVLFFPWSVILLGSLLEMVIRAARNSGYRAGAVLVAAWLIVYLGFFSLASTKLPNYIIPCYPALALMTALFVERWITRPESVPRAWPWISFGILCLAGVGIAVVTPIAARLLVEPDPTLGLVGLVPAIGAVVGMCFIWRGDAKRAVAALGLTSAIFVLWLFGLTVPRADRFQNSEAFVDTIDQLSDGPASVASFRYFRPSMVFYGRQPVTKLREPEDAGAFFSEHPQNAFLYTMDEQMPKLSKLLPSDVTVLETHRRLFKSGKILLLGRASDVPRWPTGGESENRLGQSGSHRPTNQRRRAPSASVPIRNRKSAMLQRPARQLARMGRLFVIGERTVKVVQPILSLFGSGVVTQPDLRIAPHVRTIPMQVVVRRVDFFLRRGQDVAVDHCVQVAVSQVIGEVEDNPRGEQLVDGLPEPLVQFVGSQRVGMRQPQLRREPLADGQHRRALPSQHRSQEFIFDRRGQLLHVDAANRFVQVGLEFVAQLRVAQQMLDFFGLRTASVHRTKPSALRSSTFALPRAFPSRRRLVICHASWRTICAENRRAFALRVLGSTLDSNNKHQGFKYNQPLLDSAARRGAGHNSYDDECQRRTTRRSGKLAPPAARGRSSRRRLLPRALQHRR